MASDPVRATPATYNWTAQPIPDTTPPVTTIDSGPAAETGSTSASFAFASNELGSIFRCTLDGEAHTPCTSPLELIGDSREKGTHNPPKLAITFGQ